MSKGQVAYHKLLSQSVEEKTESKSFFSYYKKDSPKLKSMHTRIQKKKIITKLLHQNQAISKHKRCFVNFI